MCGAILSSILLTKMKLARGLLPSHVNCFPTDDMSKVGSVCHLNERRYDLSENLLLASLPEEERARLLPRMERVPLILEDVLYDQNERIRYIYFPTSGVISLLCTTDEGMSIEAGTAGAEGMAGVPIFLGVD